MVDSLVSVPNYYVKEIIVILLAGLHELSILRLMEHWKLQNLHDTQLCILNSIHACWVYDNYFCVHTEVFYL